MIWWARLVVGFGALCFFVSFVVLVAMLAAELVEWFVRNVMAPVVPRERYEHETDDFARIQEAQAKASRRWFHSRRVVRFPPGEYWFYDTLQIEGDVTFRGDAA